MKQILYSQNYKDQNIATLCEMEINAVKFAVL